MSHNAVRIIISIIMGLFGGLSFATAVVPITVGRLFDIYSVDLLLAVQGFAVPMGVVWAIFAAVVAYYGGTRFGALVLGSCGALSGVVLGFFALQGGLMLLATTTLTGILYGGVGGMIIGKAFTSLAKEAQ